MVGEVVVEYLGISGFLDKDALIVIIEDVICYCVVFGVGFLFYSTNIMR